MAFFTVTITGTSHFRMRWRDAKTNIAVSLLFGSTLKSINVTSKAVFLTFFVSSKHREKPNFYPKTLRRTTLLNLSTSDWEGKAVTVSLFPGSLSGLEKAELLGVFKKEGYQERLALGF